MSARLKTDLGEGFSLTRFAGGVGRGQCVSLWSLEKPARGRSEMAMRTNGHMTVSLTREEAAKLAIELTKFAARMEVEENE